MIFPLERWGGHERARWEATASLLSDICVGRFRGTNVWISIEDSSEEERTVLGEDGGEGSVGVSGVCSEDDSRGAVICSVASVEGSVISGSSGKGSLCGPRCSLFVGEVNADNSDSSE